ncbi:hypothetical protein CDL12_23457 [Handroanthus impetiginosus]|uniref:Uncharacterized protein n=1 Tax=Handroanthus impetiginosus TaxID=429701 RepID=A0A2G9GFE3_9LAMI|nr:hypothetical protein CDL12_23457 [Handroanthus impetiginosus]
MRKLLYLPPTAAFLPPPLSSPSPSPLLQFPDLTAREGFFFSSVPVAESAFDLATICFIAVLLFLSLLAFSFILYFRLRSRRLIHLENFNSLWTVRLLLVSLISVWAFNEILRLPLVWRNYIYQIVPSITLPQQANICKLQVVLSLGFFEPGFLITLLFLVNVSIKKRKPSRIWALVSLLMICSPITLLQIVFVYFNPLEGKLPRFMHGSSVVGNDFSGEKTVLCTYPFFSCVIFGVFAVAYSMAFLLSCWRVLALVINKGIRNRINVLAVSVMVALSVQIVCLSLSWLWMPEDSAYGFVELAMFLFVTVSMAVAEVILVLRPITDALAVGADLQRRTTEGGAGERFISL